MAKLSKRFYSFQLLLLPLIHQHQRLLLVVLHSFDPHSVNLGMIDKDHVRLPAIGRHFILLLSIRIIGHDLIVETGVLAHTQITLNPKLADGLIPTMPNGEQMSLDNKLLIRSPDHEDSNHQCLSTY
jgi:hypothetical protein